MNHRPFGTLGRVGIGVSVLFLLVVVAAGPAAAEAELKIEAPGQVVVGDQVVVKATVTDGGAPVVGAEVALSFLARLGGESGWVAVATGTTNETGVVTLAYEQRALAERMRVEYFGPDGQENTEFAVEIVDGGQLYRSDAGADLPIFGVWWIVAVLAIVWGLVILAVVGIVRVGGASGTGETAAKAIPRIMVAFVALTAIGMFVVVLSRPESHANLDPTEDFDRVPRAVVGADGPYAGLGIADPGRPQGQQPGREVFVQAGCASCHGVQGEGALVGGAIVEIESGGVRVPSLDELIDEVRKGPKGMPAYGENVLTDEDVAQILDYLAEVRAP